MTRLRGAVESLLLLALVCLALPTSAQTNSAVAKHAGPMSYDVNKEITLSGTVSSLLAKHDWLIQREFWVEESPTKAAYAVDLCERRGPLAVDKPIGVAASFGGPTARARGDLGEKRPGRR